VSTNEAKWAIEDDEAECRDAMCAVGKLPAQRYDFDRSLYAI